MSKAKGILGFTCVCLVAFAVIGLWKRLLFPPPKDTRRDEATVAILQSYEYRNESASRYFLNSLSDKETSEYIRVRAEEAKSIGKTIGTLVMTGGDAKLHMSRYGALQCEIAQKLDAQFISSPAWRNTNDMRNAYFRLYSSAGELGVWISKGSPYMPDCAVP